MKNWWFWIVVLQKTFESPLESMEIKPVNPKGNQTWIFIGRTDAEAEVPILWPPHSKTRLIGKDPDAGKDWRQRRKGWQRMRWLDGISDSVHMSLSKLQKIVKDREAWCAVGHRITYSQNLDTERQHNGPSYLWFFCICDSSISVVTPQRKPLGFLHFWASSTCHRLNHSVP